MARLNERGCVVYRGKEGATPTDWIEAELSVIKSTYKDPSGHFFVRATGSELSC